MLVWGGGEVEVLVSDDREVWSENKEVSRVGRRDCGREPCWVNVAIQADSEVLREDQIFVRLKALYASAYKMSLGTSLGEASRWYWLGSTVSLLMMGGFSLS